MSQALLSSVQLQHFSLFNNLTPHFDYHDVIPSQRQNLALAVQLNYEQHYTFVLKRSACAVIGLVRECVWHLEERSFTLHLVMCLDE